MCIKNSVVSKLQTFTAVYQRIQDLEDQLNVKATEEGWVTMRYREISAWYRLYLKLL